MDMNRYNLHQDFIVLLMVFDENGSNINCVSGGRNICEKDTWNYYISFTSCHWVVVSQHRGKNIKRYDIGLLSF
jgi:hypothetical protein